MVQDSFEQFLAFMTRGIQTILFLFIFIFCGYSIDPKTNIKAKSKEELKEMKKDAAELFTASKYKNALSIYLELFKTDSQNVEYNYRIGFCYLETSINKKAAMKYLETANQSKNVKKEWIYYLGLACMYNENWDEAIHWFKNFKNVTRSKLIKDFLNPDRMIEMCINGKDLCANPVNCVFRNAGKNINLSYPDYNPFISADGNSLIFTSRRKGNAGNFIEELGTYTSDIYWSQRKDLVWTKAKNVGANINSEWDEETVGFSSMGECIYVYYDNEEAFADLGKSTLKGKIWQKTETLPNGVNSLQYEGGACSTLDGNTIYFSSSRKDGFGGSDLWMIKREKNGVWGIATNMGNNINSSYDEDSPFLSLDGKKLFFSSKGWNSMGGFDIFCSTWNEREKNWSIPVNIGFPLNDADDNNFISFTGSERFAYLSALRPDGFGDRDIYEVEFLDNCIIHLQI